MINILISGEIGKHLVEVDTDKPWNREDVAKACGREVEMAVEAMQIIKKRDGKAYDLEENASGSVL